MGSLGGFYEVPMGSLWVSMGPSGSLWVPMGSLWIPKGLYGCLGVSMGVYVGDVVGGGGPVWGTMGVWGPYGVLMGSLWVPPLTPPPDDVTERRRGAALMGSGHIGRGGRAPGEGRGLRAPPPHWPRPRPKLRPRPRPGSAQQRPLQHRPPGSQWRRVGGVSLAKSPAPCP